MGLAHLMSITPVNSSLFNGRLGQVALFAYAHRLLGEDSHWDLATQHLMAVMDEVAQGLANQQLSALTVAGLGQLLTILRRDQLMELELDDEYWCLFDKLVVEWTRQQLRNRNTDLLAGAAAGLHYLSIRAAAGAAVAAHIEVVVEELAASQMQDAMGSRFGNSHIERLNKTTDLNMGFAHGHWGLLMVLLRICQLEYCPAQAGQLVEGMLQYALGWQQTSLSSTGSLFPHTIPLKAGAAADYDGFLGWCYGDIMASLVLYRAHQVLARPTLWRIAALTGTRACWLSQSDGRTLTTGLCHGSASLVAGYGALYQMHPKHCYARAHSTWLHYTIQKLQQELLHLPAAQFAGSLLNGLSGTLLVLISELSDITVSWPSILLLDVPSTAVSKYAPKFSLV